MATNKYQVKVFQPNANQVGMGRSVYAEAVVDNVINNRELAKKIEARGISRAAEIKGILEEAANIIMEEVCENNRVQLEGERGILVSIAPTVSGSLSDKQVRENPEKYKNAQQAEPDMLTADMLTWGIKAEVGRNFSKQFALNKTAQRVDGGTPASITTVEEPTGDSNLNGGDNGNTNLNGGTGTIGGGGDNGGGNSGGDNGGGDNGNEGDAN